MSHSIPVTVACPECGRAVEWSQASPDRPFCSERCRLIDLGEWFAENRGVPDDDVDGQPADDAFFDDGVS